MRGRRGGLAALAATLAATAAGAEAQAQVPALPPLAPQPHSGPARVQPQPSAARRSRTARTARGSAAVGTVAVGANPARSGVVADYTLAPPLRRRWSVRSNAL